MNNDGLFGPFENPDDIAEYWHQIKEKELKESIKQIRTDLDTPDNSEKDREIYKQDLKNLSRELKLLQEFVDDHLRCIERYKFDKKILQKVQDDWHEYNFSLYTDWSRIQSIVLDSLEIEGKSLGKHRTEAKVERIKREEIEKRMKDLLSK